MKRVILLLFLGIFLASKAKTNSILSDSSINIESSFLIDYQLINPKTTLDINSLKSGIASQSLVASLEVPFVLMNQNLFKKDFSLLSEKSYKKIENFGSFSVSNSIINKQSKEKLSVLSYDMFGEGLFFGFASTLILLNIVCFFIFSERNFFYFGLSILTTMLLLLYSDGLYSLFFNEIALNDFIVRSLFLLFVTGTSALFANYFLSIKQYLPKLKWVTSALMGIGAIATMFAWFTKNEIFALIATISFFTVISLYFISGIYIFSKNNYVKLYIIANCIPLLFCVDFFLFQPLQILFLATESIHIKTALITQMLLLTYAIIYRMQYIREENEMRQVELRIFLKRQEALTARQKTEVLIGSDVYLENLIMHYDLDGLEIKLLQYISEGKENEKIARKLRTTEEQVEELTKELYHKLEISEQIKQDQRMVEEQPDYIYN